VEKEVAQKGVQILLPLPIIRITICRAILDVRGSGMYLGGCGTNPGRVNPGCWCVNLGCVNLGCVNLGCLNLGCV
jgi:hypothetical protein